MFWSYIGNYKEVVKRLHNQTALHRLKILIKNTEKKQTGAAFKKMIKNDKVGELEFYLKEEEKYWIFIYPFNDFQACFAKNETIDALNSQIDNLIDQEKKDVINLVLHRPIGGFNLPRKTDLKSRWFWLSTVLTNSFWLFIYIIFGLVLSFISAMYWE